MLTWCSFTAFDKGITYYYHWTIIYITRSWIAFIGRKPKILKLPFAIWVKLSVSFYRTWISLVNFQDPQIILIINWDSGSSKVAKMGVLPSDQWRTSLFFPPNYCLLLSSISCFLPGNELTGTMPAAFAQLPDLTIL